jgi:hypothetical protein
MIEDRDHNIWAEAIGNPARLVRVQDFEIRAELPAPQMPAAAAPAADPQNGIWLGLVNGNLAHYRSRQLDIIPVTHGQPLRVRQVLVSSDGSALGATPAGSHLSWRQSLRTSLELALGYFSSVCGPPSGECSLPLLSCGLFCRVSAIHWFP